MLLIDEYSFHYSLVLEVDASLIDQKQALQDTCNLLVADLFGLIIDGLIEHLYISLFQEGDERLPQQVPVWLSIEDEELEGWGVTDDQPIPDARFTVQVGAKMIIYKDESLVDVEDVAQPADLVVQVYDQLLGEVFVVEELLTEHVSLALSVQQISDVPVILPMKR